MNRTILLTTAALAVAFVQPSQAWARGDGGDGHSGGGGGGGARAAGGAAFHGGGGGSVRGGGGPSMRVSQAPHFASHVQSTPRSQEQSFALRQPMQSPRTFSRPNNANTFVNNRSFNGANRRSPTVAFGGSAPMSRDAEVRQNRSFNSTADARHFSRPSGEVSRNWDRRQMHTWNNHRYRWYNNNWVLFDSGFGYGYPYYYGGYAPYDDYDYDSAPYDNSAAALPYEYSTTDSLASSVQEELVRKGYNPGAVDGVIGPQTRNAIAQFQSDHHLRVTGQIDRSLLGAMGL